MGNYVNTFGILLDEQDLPSFPHTSCDALAETVENILHGEFANEDDWPAFEFYGIASERFGTSSMFEESKHIRLLKSEGTFLDALTNVFNAADVPDPAAFAQQIKDGTENMRAQLVRKAHEYLDEGWYYQAERAAAALRSMKATGMPGIKAETYFNSFGDEGVFDFRKADRGSGTRLLAEIGFNHGQ